MTGRETRSRRENGSARGNCGFASGWLSLLAFCGVVIAANALAAQTVRLKNPDKVARTSATRAAAPEGDAAKIAAVVNGQPITRDELAMECLRRFGKTVLEGEINKFLIRQECQRHSIEITEQEIDEEIARVAAGLRLTPERFYGVIEQERQITREQYRHDIVWPMLALRRLAADQLQVTKDELQRAYESEFGPRVQVRMISVSSEPKARKLHSMAGQKPDDFDRLAKDYSEDPNTAAARGLVPPIRRHAGYPEIEQVAFGLKEGQISPVMKVADQYLIIKCERHIPATNVPPEHREKVVEDLKQRLRDTKMRSVASDVFKQLQTRAKVVNVMNDPELQKQMPGVAATINGGRIMMKDLGEQCIIRHGTDVLDGEINRRLLQQALRRRSLQVTREDVNEEIRRAAESFGFLNEQGQIDTQAWLKQVTTEGDITVELYVRDVVWPSVALKKLVTSKIEVTGEDLQKGFTANYGPRAEVLAIVMNDQRTAHEVFKMARDNDTEQWFGELAHQYSVEPVSRANYGQVPPIRRFGGQPLLEEEAFRLQPGETSGVLVVGDKFILLRCLGFTEPVVDDMQAVRDELAKDIIEKKMRIAMTTEFDRLKDGSHIDNFLTQTSQVPRQKEIRPAAHESPAGQGQAAPTRNAARRAPAKPSPQRPPARR